MSTLKRLILAAGLTVASTQAFTQGFDFCVAPPLPACMKDNTTFKSAGRQAACDDDVKRYVASLVTYRSCMYAAVGRTLSRSNEELAAFRCRAATGRNCPTSP